MEERHIKSPLKCPNRKQKLIQKKFKSENLTFGRTDPRGNLYPQLMDINTNKGQKTMSINMKINILTKVEKCEIMQAQ